MNSRRLLQWFSGLMLVVLTLAGCGGEEAEPTAAPTSTPALAPTSTPTSVPPATPEAKAYWPTEGWRTSTPEEQGMDSEKLADLLAIIKKGRYNIDSVTVIRNGYMVLDAAYYPFIPDAKHQVHACTQSITSALIGIAIDKGYIESVGQPALDLFPDRTIANLSADKEAMTLEDVLTMSTGLECRDTYLYGWRGMQQMQQSPDWVQFVLDLPMAEEPGTKFEWCHGASFLLSAIIQETTGMSALEFAEKHLFAPLGISDVVWPSNPQGINIGWGELRIRPHDLAKIGYLYLNGGLWDGEQVVSSAWAEASTREQIAAGTLQHGYGYLWWIDDSGIYMTLGSAGQYLLVVPDREMVVVFTSDLSDARFNTPQILLNGTILPAAEAPAPLPPNPDGVAKLQSLIQEAAQQPEVTPQPVPPPPAIAEQVLGERYLLEENQLGWQSFSLASQGPDEAVLRLTFDASASFGQTDFECRLGLDGVQRVTAGWWGMPAVGTGRWEGENDFVAEVDEIGNITNWRLKLQFKDDEVTTALTGNFPGQYVIQGKRAGSP